MNRKLCLEGDLRKRAIAEGVDVVGLDKELSEIEALMKQARINVRKKRGWIKHFFIVLFTEFPIPRLGWTHPEEQEEFDKLSGDEDAK